MFYLTLPSNSSLSYFPNNTLTNYTVKLPQTIDLKGDWEVGLVEIIYPHSWYNVHKGDVNFTVVTQREPVVLKKVAIDAGYYDNPRQLTTTINEAMKKYTNEKNVQLHYNEVTQRMAFEFKNDNIVVLSQGLQAMLGFHSIQLNKIPPYPMTEAQRVVDMERGFDNLYVYCDIVEQRIVGDVFAPLLRIIPNTGKDGEVVRRIYDAPHFIPVSRKRFETIEIDIKDDAGHPVPFERGKVLITLQFRERESF